MQSSCKGAQKLEENQQKTNQDTNTLINKFEFPNDLLDEMISDESPKDNENEKSGQKKDNVTDVANYYAQKASFCFSKAVKYQTT